MYLCLFEDDIVPHFLPLVHTRAVYDLRIGMRTIVEMVSDAFANPPLLLHSRAEVAATTRQEHPNASPWPTSGGVLFVNGRYIPSHGTLLERLRRAARPNEPGRVFVQGEQVVAAWVPDITTFTPDTGPVTRASFDVLD